MLDSGKCRELNAGNFHMYEEWGRGNVGEGWSVTYEVCGGLLIVGEPG